MNRTNQSLAIELACKKEEFENFKRTVLTTYEKADSLDEKFRSEVPSFLKVMQAETTLNTTYPTNPNNRCMPS